MTSGRRSEIGIDFRALSIQSGLHEQTLRRRYRDNPSLTPEELMDTSNRMLIDGKTLFDIAKETGIPYQTLRYRYKHGFRTYEEVTQKMPRPKKVKPDVEQADELNTVDIAEAVVEEPKEEPKAEPKAEESQAEEPKEEPKPDEELTKQGNELGEIEDAFEVFWKKVRRYAEDHPHCTFWDYELLLTYFYNRLQDEHHRNRDETDLIPF